MEVLQRDMTEPNGSVDMGLFFFVLWASGMTIISAAHLAFFS